MRAPVIISLAVAAVIALGGDVASAAEPPNQNDPCSTAGRDSCGTLGSGRYIEYRYGVRWFGGYKGAVRGVKLPTFCIDLRFWYPSPKYDYKERGTGKLANRNGRAVSKSKLRRMSYVLWNYGRSTGDTQQSAVMLYVHHLMGDGAPGEIEPGVAGPKAERLYRKMASEAAKLSGPYKVKLSVGSRLKAGKPAQLKVTVLSSSGAKVPGATVGLDAEGARGLAAKVTTNSKGIATTAFTPGAKLTIRATTRLAAPEPTLYVPTRGASARNGQRLAAANSSVYSAKLKRSIAPTKIKVSTTATPAEITVGAASTDKITISGAPKGWHSQATVSLFGPYRTTGDIDCAGAPFAKTQRKVSTEASVSSPVTLTAPGFYTYRITVKATKGVLGATTPCGVKSETLKVMAVPQVVTQVSDQTGGPGLVVTDKVTVSGLAGESATVTASLHGPFASAADIKCDGTPYWQGSFTANGDGTYTTDPVTLNTAGYYTYYETIAGGEFVRAGATACAEAAETTVIRGAPKITTQVSNAKTKPGSSIHDTAVISGLGGLSAPVKVELWGPYDTRAEIDCRGKPYATQNFTANGDGSYKTKAVKLREAGFYTYREAILETDAYSGAQTECGEAAETTIAKATPKIATQVSDDAVIPDTVVSDRVKVDGLEKTPAKVKVELFGPFATRGAISCSGNPVVTQRLSVDGDGTYSTPKVKLPKAGFYTYREEIEGTQTIAGARTACAEVPETTLARPAILTGRGDPRADPVPAGLRVSGRPTRVSISRLGISAPVTGVGIDIGQEILAVPDNIDRTGWWADGGDPISGGTTLIAGHVDSAARGAGAFFNLKNARQGDTIELALANGSNRTYVVTETDEVIKAKLPAGIFTAGGPDRLVLVTCGGKFLSNLGHYRDNIIVTARPR